MPDIEVAKMEIAKLELKEGDVLVLRGNFSSHEMHQMVDFFAPKVAILFIGPRTEITRLTPSEREDVKRQLEGKL